MPTSKIKVTSKKQQKQNLKDLHSERATAAERQWLKGYRTTMEQDILDAGKKEIKIQ